MQTKLTENKNANNAADNSVYKWLSISDLAHLYPSLKSEKFDTLKRLRLIEDTDLEHIKATPYERENMLTLLGRYEPNQKLIGRLFDWIKPRSIKQVVSEETMLSQIEQHEKEKLWKKQQKNKSTDTDSLSKRIKFYLKVVAAVTLIATTAAHFGHSSYTKSKAREKVVQLFPYEREEVKALSNKLGISIADLFEIEKICAKQLLGKNLDCVQTIDHSSLVKLDDFIDILLRVFHSKRDSKEEPDKSLCDWEFLCLYRNSPQTFDEKGNIFIPIGELLDALTILPKDSNDKLKFIFNLHSTTRSADPNETEIDFKNLSIVYEKLLRFRHFYADSVLKKTQTFPLKKYRTFYPEEMAKIVLFEHYQNINNLKGNTVGFEEFLKEENIFINLSDFEEVCKRISPKKHPSFEHWYYNKNEF